MLGYLKRRGRGEGPLFLFANGRFLTRARFVKLVQDGLKKSGFDDSRFCGLSFRFGAATTAAANGVEESVIKTLGCWESLAYLQYMRIP